MTAPGDPTPRTDPHAGELESTVGVPALPVRLVQVVVSPAQLFDRLRDRPLWFWALLLGAVLTAVSVVAVPADIWSEMTRAQLLEAGQEIPPGMENAGNVFRIGGAIAAPVFWFVTAFLFCGILTGIFAFVLGDDVGYRQMLAAWGHAMWIPALGSLLVVPLRIARRDPQVLLSVGTFVPGLEGWLGAFLGGLDLFSLWAYFLVGLAVSRFDPRRSAGVASAISVGLLVAVVAVIAIFQA